MNPSFFFFNCYQAIFSLLFWLVVIFAAMQTIWVVPESKELWNSFFEFTPFAVTFQNFKLFILLPLIVYPVFGSRRALILIWAPFYIIVELLKVFICCYLSILFLFFKSVFMLVMPVF